MGGALGRNSIGVVIRCHRVIAGGGSIGGYGGDWFETREQLLAINPIPSKAHRVFADSAS